MKILSYFSTFWEVNRPTNNIIVFIVFSLHCRCIQQTWVRGFGWALIKVMTKTPLVLRPKVKPNVGLDKINQDWAFKGLLSCPYFGFFLLKFLAYV